jgi:hypothetical protein
VLVSSYPENFVNSVRGFTLGGRSTLKYHSGNGGLHFRFEAELILHQLGHLLRQGVVLLRACSWCVTRMRESVDGTVVPHLVVASAVQIPL